MSSKKSKAEADEAFASLVNSIVSVPNPQQNVSGEPGEAKLAQHICEWLTDHGIEYEADLKWGVHAKLTGPDGPGGPGMLLGAHMDSDHLKISDLRNIHLDRTKGNQGTLMCPGQVGLDCKTGIAIALSVLERLQQAPPAGGWQVHCLFTIGEESGQKGAVLAPVQRLLQNHVRYGIVIDRMTRGANAPVDSHGKPLRHAVSVYKGVPLLAASSGAELLHHLNVGVAAVDPSAAARGALPLIESPNCADAIELRGRWDAEVIAPMVGEPKADGGRTPPAALVEAISEYRRGTVDLVARMAKCAPDERVSSMNSHPRITRYHAMRAVHDALHGGKDGAPLYDEGALGFSCVNLSYDYDDADGYCDLEELDKTARIVLHACVSAFGRMDTSPP